MTDKKFSPLGFELRTSSVDPWFPLLFRTGIVDGAASDMQVIYFGMSRDGAKAPFSNYDDTLRRMQDGRAPRNGKRFRQIHRDIDIALREGKSVVIELVRNVDTDTELLAAAKKVLQRAHGLSD